MHNKGPVHLQEITEKEKSLMPPLGHEIVYRQQKSSVITVFNLISLIVNNNLTSAERISKLKLLEEVNWLKDIMETFGAFVHIDLSINNSIDDSFIVHSNLIKLGDDQTVQLIVNEIAQGNINPKKMKAHSLSDKTMTFATPFVMLQIYINAMLHYLVDAAFIVCILEKHNALTKGKNMISSRYK